jgi:hypothetical protein
MRKHWGTHRYKHIEPKRSIRALGTVHCNVHINFGLSKSTSSCIEVMTRNVIKISNDNDNSDLLGESMKLSSLFLFPSLQARQNY